MNKKLGRPSGEVKELKSLRWSTLIKPSVGSIIDSMKDTMQCSRADVLEKLVNEHLERKQ